METCADRAPHARAASLLALCAAAVSLSTACGGASPSGARGPAETSGVEAADLPFRVLRARGGQEIGWSAFVAELGKSDAVCLGENHRNPHDHWAQLHVLDQLTARNRKAGVTTALGLEMFQRPFQGVLDDFVARRIDEAALLSRSGWKDRWGFDWKLYRPMVLMARDRGAAILALNTPRELTKKVSRRGVSRLDASDRRALPELVLNDPDHRAWWDSLMESMGGAHGHSSSQDDQGDEGEEGGGEEGEGEDGAAGARRAPHGPGKPAKAVRPAGKEDEEGGEEGEPDADDKAAGERIYTAQVLWDESMAEGASAWLKNGSSASPSRRQVIILAGNGHCHESAIVRRIERRGVAAAVSVRPIIDDGEGNVAELLAAPENDYLFVMTPPRR